MSTNSARAEEGCRGRLRYATYAEADQQAWFAMSRRRPADDDFMLAAHFCPRCSGWHIGNPRTQSSERWSASFA
jgi:hypothetical protein